MYLALVGNSKIHQFTVEEDGLYAWRNTRSQSEWIVGPLKKGNKIDGQYEGCGPILFEAQDDDTCVHGEGCLCI